MALLQARRRRERQSAGAGPTRHGGGRSRAPGCEVCIIAGAGPDRGRARPDRAAQRSRHDRRAPELAATARCAGVNHSGHAGRWTAASGAARARPMIRATMRLQFHKGFTFAHAERLARYFAALGIGQVYASPIATARPSSMHGYDVIDPTRVNPELGGEDGLRRLVAALRAVGLGLIVDIVPNHMAACAANAWWFDVLKHGTASRYAGYFDIDWDAEDAQLCGKVLLPVLGKPFRDVIASGEIALAQAGDGFAAHYFSHVFPIAVRHRDDIERAGLPAFDAKTAEGRQRLAALLQDQNYRLADWRVANDEINWRRFFDIN